MAGEGTTYGREERGGEYTRQGWYRFITDVQHGVVAERFACTWRLPDGVGCRATFLGQAGAQFFAGRAPSIVHRNEEGKWVSNYRDNDLVDKVMKPVLCLRRTTDAKTGGGGDDRSELDPLTSTFVSVIEPFQGKPLIREARLLNLTGNDAAVAVGVSFAGTAQVLLSAVDAAEPALCDDAGLRFQGQFGAISFVGDELETMVLCGGPELTDSAHGCALRQSGAFTGEVDSLRGDLTGAAENVIVTSSALPTGMLLAGQVLSLEHADGTTSAHVIAEVRTVGGSTEIVLGPGRCFVLARCRLEKVQAEPPQWHTMDSLLKSMDGSFDGKWATVAGLTCRVKQVSPAGRMNYFFPGFNIELAEGADAEGVAAGAEVMFHAARAGDRFRIANVAGVMRLGPGHYRLEATDTTQVTLPARPRGRTLSLRGPHGKWRVVATQAKGAATVTGRVEATDLAAGPAELRLR